MKAFQLTRKFLVESWREPQLLIIYLAFPAVLIGIYYISFGAANQISMAQYLKIMILNQDQGPRGEELVNKLQRAQFEGQPVFGLQVIETPGTAEMALKERKTALLLTIPSDFSAAVEAARSGGSPAVLRLDGDPLSDTYSMASGFLRGEVDSFTDNLINWQVPSPVRTDFVENTGKLTDFQFGVPGVLAFGILFCMITTAIALVREESSGTLVRLRLAGTTTRDLLVGTALSQAVLAAVQLPLAFLAAIWMGFSSPGSLLTAILTGMLLSLPATGLGLTAAAFTHSDGEAANLATAFLVPLGFLSGAMFPVPAVPLFQVGERVIGLFDLMPSTHACEILRRVLIYGDGPGQLIYPIGGLVLLSIIYLAAGAWIYQRRRLQVWM